MRWKISRILKIKKGEKRSDAVVRTLLANRGLVTKKQQQDFFSPKNPYQLTPRDVGISAAAVKRAVNRIKQTVKRKEKVVVYGDYDTDGVCATAILWEAMHQLGVQVMPFIPGREEGYGLKVDRLAEFAKAGIRLVVTVDQGIVQNRQAAYAKKIGLDLIITDHHVAGAKKPLAKAIVHTVQLSGAGVAWFLAKAMGTKPDLDLVTIGMVADVMPLLGPNRAIAKAGLKRLAETKRLGLRALYQFAGLEPEKIEAYHIGFIIGPRLNAAGRMSDPMDSLRLLCTRDERRARVLAQKLDQKNRERQTLEKQTTNHARRCWLDEDGQSPLIFVYHQTWQYGVIGLTARSLAEEFYRPAVVLAPRAEHWVASARSIEEFNIVKAVRSCADLLDSHGGHAQAAGFSVAADKLELVKEKLLDVAQEKLGGQKLARQLKIECEVQLSDLSGELFLQLKKFAPFGRGNPQPVFASRGVRLIEAWTVGNGSQHLKLQVVDESSGAALEAIGFGLGSRYTQLNPEKPIDIAHNLELDTWNNQEKLQLKLKDIKVKS